MRRFEKKVVLITGATAGIGRATAFAFAAEGARVVVSGRNEKAGADTVEQIEKNGGEAIFVKTDVTTESEVKALVEQTVRVFGKLDIAFNNSGIEQMPTPLAETSVADFDAVMNTNVKGVFLSLKYQIPAMLRSGGGSIINNSSVAGLIGMGGIPIYVASKHAVNGLTKSAALEFAKQNVRVNAVAPGGVDTGMLDRFLEKVSIDAMNNMHPVGRIGKPDEIAQTVLFLASDAASFITGQILAVDGGFTAQ